MKRRLAATSLIFSFLLLVGCVAPSAVDEFAKSTQEAAKVFPAVADIPYDACVGDEKNLEIASVTTFDATFNFDQRKIDEKCKRAQETSQRLKDVFSLITAYIAALDKLAGGSVPTYDTNIQSIGAGIPDLNSTQQKAVSGLAGLVADLVNKGYRQKKAIEAIETAQPWIDTLTGMLREDLTKSLQDYINNEKSSLESLYRDMNQFRTTTTAPSNGTSREVTEHTSPVLLTKLFIEQRSEIDTAELSLKSFNKILADIDRGHTELYDNRHKLWDKKTIQDLFQTASSIGKQVSTVESAFTASAKKSTAPVETSTGGKKKPDKE